MDADPWADAPPSPRPADPASPVSPGRPAATAPSGSATSPLAESSTARVAETSSPSPQAAPPLTAAESPRPSALGDSAEADDGFDEFDDFDEPAAGPSSGGGAGFVSATTAGEDDGFGDFGDFEEGDFEEAQEEPAAGAMLGGQIAHEPQPVDERWQSLRLRPFPPRGELLSQLTDLLAPLFASSSGPGSMSDEPPRMVGGLRQIMVDESSRDAYVQLNTPPMLKPLDWTRSRVRREHLISMGVPVNLDEVDSHRLSALPPLRITTSMGPPPPRPRPVSADRAGRGSLDSKGKPREVNNGAASVPASAIPSTNGGLSKYGLGERPAMDPTRAEDLCGIDEARLSLLPIESLKTMQADLVETSAQASALLAWLLQLKDAQTQDSQTYNGMISELIANAAKAKSAQQTGSGGVFRRASGRQRPQSTSGNVTPRIGSPAMR
ncbi:hypothetical protein JCM24511_02279 [Saitozyma sp. JCM 24511]|nr:hypothetical protein JCM24511_02279 [Saitozyma sp. JCM 24511]